MSNLINFLETIGQNSQLRHASKPTLYNAMNQQQIEADAQWAIMRGDQAKLASFMHARKSMACLIMAPQAHAEQVFVESSQYFAKAG